MLMSRSAGVRHWHEVRYEVEDVEIPSGERKGWWVPDFEEAARIYGDAIREASRALEPHIVCCSQVAYFEDGSTRMAMLHRSEVGGYLS